MNTTRRYLKSLVDDLQDRVNTLKTFNRQNEIESYCLNLESQVLITVQRAVKHLYELEQELLDEIAKYRAELNQAVYSSASRPQDEEISSKQIENLQRDVDRLKDECSAYFSQANIRRELYENTVNLHTELLGRVNAAYKSMRNSTFGHKFMEFTPNHLFTIPRNYIGEIRYKDEESSVQQGIDDIFNQNSLKLTLSDHREDCKQMVFLCNNLFSSCSLEATIRVWNLQTGKTAFVLRESSVPILSQIEYPVDVILSGNAAGHITRWVIDDQSGYRCLSFQAHKSSVTAFKELSDGCLLSFSSDGTMKKWNNFAIRLERELFSFGDHGCTGEFPLLDRLENGYLVTCSSHCTNSVMKIWNPADGKLVKEIQTNVGELTAICALWNNEVVVCSSKGLLKIINIVEPSSSRTLVKEESRCPYYCLLELPNGYFVTSVSKTNPVLQIWDPSTSKLVQTLASGHKNRISSITKSFYNRHMATASLDKTIKFFRFLSSFEKCLGRGKSLLALQKDP